MDGEQINGSDDIISTLLNQQFVVEALEKKWNQENDPKMTLSLFTHGMDNKTLQFWTRAFANDLAAILYPNICKTWADSYQAFGYVDTMPNTGFSYLDKFLIRNVGSLAMTLAAFKIKST